MQLGLERRQLGGRVFLLGAGLGGHGLDRFELFARDQIEIRGKALHALLDAQLDFFAQTAHGVHGAAGDLGEIVEQAVLRLHGLSPRAVSVLRR